MKKVHLLSWLVLFISLFPSILQAQSYDELWKEVEASQKKDLPKTVISVVDKIYTKAKGEKNIPQMMKAYIVRAESRIQLTPDSAQAEYDGIRRWAESETNLVGRAALNHIMGSLILDNQQLGTEDDAIRYFRLSLKDKEALGEASAKDFRPMTTSGELSEKYLNDNMFDLLSRQAIDRLSAYRFVEDRQKCVSEALALYDDLIAFYSDNNNRQAALLTKEARVLYCWEGAGSSIVREALIPEKAAEELRKLAEEYKDLPVCADVYVKLAHVYRMNNQPLKSVEAAREGIEKYPAHEWVSQLRSYIDFASSPYLSVNIPQVYPKQEADINVTYANLKGVSFELYRLKISPASSLLRGNLKEETLIKNYGTKIASRHYALSPTPDYEKRDTVLHYTLPEAGIYMLKQIPQEAEKGIDYSLLFVSPYQCISIPVSEERKEFVVVDKLTGKPVPGAEVVTYRLNSNEYSVLQVYKTDGKGSTMVDIPRLGRIYYNVRTAGNDFAAISSIGRKRIVCQGNGARMEEKSELVYRPFAVSSGTESLCFRYGLRTEWRFSSGGQGRKDFLEIVFFRTKCGGECGIDRRFWCTVGRICLAAEPASRHVLCVDRRSFCYNQGRRIQAPHFRCGLYSLRRYVQHG